MGDKKDRQLAYAYPVTHKEHYLSTKSRKVVDAFNVRLNEFGELQDITKKDEQICPVHRIERWAPSQNVEGCALCQSGKTRSSAYKKAIVETGIAVEEGAEVEDEQHPKRYKDNFALVPRLAKDLYSDHDILVDVKCNRLISDPVTADRRYKENQVWSVDELRAYLSLLSEQPRFSWLACQRLPSKTSKDILAFSQSMFALMRLDEFLSQTSNIRVSRRNNRDLLVREVLETIDSFL